MMTPEEGEHVSTNCAVDLGTLKLAPAFYTRDEEREQFTYLSKGEIGIGKIVVLRGKEY